MIKKLIGLLSAVLALNFLAVAGGVGYLVATKKLDREKVHTIRSLIQGAPTTQPSGATTQPSTQPSPEDAPMLRLEALLAKAAMKPAAEQADYVRGELDAQAAQIERREREVADQRDQIALARTELEKSRVQQAQKQKQVDAVAESQTKQAADEGFQKTLELYQSLPAKQVKSLFAGMNDDTVVRYLQAMEKEQAASVLKAFKTPQETSRAQVLLEKMRQAQAKAE